MRRFSAPICRQNSWGSTGSKESEGGRKAQSCAERLQQLELWRHQENEKRRSTEEKRRERLQAEEQLRQEDSAKRSLQAMMKRQMREAAADQQEAARVACLAKRQEARERRAEERKVQQMKQREFQRELSSLRDISRAMDIERQRRREEAEREAIEEALRRKCERVDVLAQEKQRLWKVRHQERKQRETRCESLKETMSRTPVASKRASLVSKLSMALSSISASAPVLTK